MKSGSDMDLIWASFARRLPPRMNAAVFFDRDGTLIEDRDYLKDPSDVAFFPGAIDGLRRLQDAGYALVMVTNQSGVARGYFTESDVASVHDHLRRELEREGVTLTAIYYAPEAPGEPSRGRKPSPQFLFDARDTFGIALEHSFMIGDKLSDLQCGWNAGVRGSLLVRTGKGSKVEEEHRDRLKEVPVFSTFAEAARYILEL